MDLHVLTRVPSMPAQWWKWSDLSSKKCREYPICSTFRGVWVGRQKTPRKRTKSFQTTSRKECLENRETVTSWGNQKDLYNLMSQILRKGKKGIQHQVRACLATFSTNYTGSGTKLICPKSPPAWGSLSGLELELSLPIPNSWSHGPAWAQANIKCPFSKYKGFCVLFSMEESYNWGGKKNQSSHGRGKWSPDASAICPAALDEADRWPVRGIHSTAEGLRLPSQGEGGRPN